jgi:hypothetical protein
MKEKGGRIFGLRGWKRWVAQGLPILPEGFLMDKSLLLLFFRKEGLALLES